MPLLKNRKPPDISKELAAARRAATIARNQQKAAERSAAEKESELIAIKLERESLRIELDDLRKGVPTERGQKP